MKSFALCSGSSGNCFYVESKEGVKILVDIGLSFSKAKEILDERGIDINSIDALFITHEHSDHVAGLQTFMNKIKCTVYMSQGSAKELKLKEDVKILKHHDYFSIGDMNIFSISKPHDASEALSFVFDDGRKLGIFTDLGHVSDEIKHTIKTLDIIYFEANYCENHIEEVKHMFSTTYLNRLMSDFGHLGLHQTCQALVETANDSQKIMLSHISENTNSYENAYLKVRESLRNAGLFPQILVSFQGEPTEWIE